MTKKLAGRSCSEITTVHIARASHALTMIATPAELLVALLYWLVLYTPGTDDTPILLYRDLVVHAMCCLTIWIDLVVGNKRFPDRHVVITLIMAVAYLLVNLGVTLGTGIYVYSVLTWKSGGTAGLVIGALIAVIVFFYLAGWIAWLLNLLAKTCGPFACCSDSSQNDSTAAFSRKASFGGEVYLAALGGVVPKTVAEAIAPASAKPEKGEVLGVVFAQAAILAADPFPAHPNEGQGTYNQPFAQKGLGFYDEWVSLPTKFWCCVPKLQKPMKDAPSVLELANVGSTSATSQKDRRSSQVEQLKVYRSAALASGTGSSHEAGSSGSGAAAAPSLESASEAQPAPASVQPVAENV
jgi:hypothetical protein